jgi:hypothetical protein
MSKRPARAMAPNPIERNAASRDILSVMSAAEPVSLISCGGTPNLEGNDDVNDFTSNSCRFSPVRLRRRCIL